MQAYAKAKKAGKMLDVRLNGTSDLDWSEVYARFPDINFHEYTKRTDLALQLKQFNNVNVTFSRHENHTDSDIKTILDAGMNVAVALGLTAGDGLRMAAPAAAEPVMIDNQAYAAGAPCAPGLCRGTTTTATTSMQP